jgi:glutaredoxin-like protein NrdH
VVKEFLSRHGVAYELRDVTRDEQALREFLALGLPLPPVTVVDGVAVQGYQPDRLERLLGLYDDE